MVDNGAQNEFADWRWQLARAPRDWPSLAAALRLSPSEIERRQGAAERYPPLATPYYLSLADLDDPDDPIRRQILPDPAEIAPAWTAAADPLGEQDNSPVFGLVHRYPDRALILLNARCAVHCRHCLRKRNWGRELAWSQPRFERALRYLREHQEIREVILSGGDPLLSEDATISRWLRALAGLPRVSSLRIGSRLPVVLPQRFTDEFCAMLGESPGAWLATHFNHPRELTGEAGAACRRLLRAGVPLVNQSVLLKGVNDRAEVLRELGLGLLRIGVKPYYLFHGDPVAGTRHFRTGIRRGLEIMAELRGTVSGLAIPAFAIDLPDGGGKLALTPDSCVGSEGGAPCFKGLGGRVYRYADDDPEPRRQKPEAGG